jgi:hypothetical protein
MDSEIVFEFGVVWKGKTSKFMALLKHVIWELSNISYHENNKYICF